MCVEFCDLTEFTDFMHNIEAKVNCLILHNLEIMALKIS